MLSFTSPPTWADPPEAGPTIEDVRSARQSGDFKTAIKHLEALEKLVEDDLSVDFVLLARSGKAQLDTAEIDQLYRGALRSLTKSGPNSSPPGQRLLIRLTAANHFAKASQHDKVATVLLDAFDELKPLSFDATGGRATALIDLAVKTAWAELNATHCENAEKLYGIIVSFSEREGWKEAIGTNRALAMLGLGWATGIQPDREIEAAERLRNFTDNYPNHKDGASAAAMRIGCLQKLDDQDTPSAIAEFLDRWPDSEQAGKFVIDTLSSPSQNHLTLRESNVPDDSSNESESPLSNDSPLAESILNWISNRPSLDDHPPELATYVLRCFGTKLPARQFDSFLNRHLDGDKTGQQTALLLHELSEDGSHAVAESIAALLISGDLDRESKMARESACRWAGRTGRWTMLALAANSVSPEQATDKRSIGIDRLFAEALTQTGQGKVAAKWWAHVVDHYTATDFATLLRCAEAAVANSDIPDAQRRLDEAARALPEGSENSVQASFIELLSADLAVRRVNFEHARSLFDRVVRNPASPTALRARAQWMIGETFFMQNQFKQAISAYRQVESLDPQGPYIPASLVQAGKSFEQLGRTHEAGVCYSTLLGRFADSPHAHEATRRMAALPGGQGGQPGSAPPDSSRLRR